MVLSGIIFFFLIGECGKTGEEEARCGFREWFRRGFSGNVEVGEDEKRRGGRGKIKICIQEKEVLQSQELSRKACKH